MDDFNVTLQPMNTNTQYILFLDLDGVLVDFEKGVEGIFGKPIRSILPRQMWPRLAKTPDFYNTLDWMPDGRALWEYCRPFKPIILTGLPMGKWADPQKRAWCRRELGDGIEVITGLSRHKPSMAIERSSGRTAVLVDDREKLRLPFEVAGGIFIHHRNTRDTIQTLQQLKIG